MEEGETQRAVRAPGAPTKKDVDEHNLTHCSYRSWCDACVRGQAKDGPPSTIVGELAESTLVRVVMDYCFIQEGVAVHTPDHGDTTNARTNLVVLVVLESLCHSTLAYAVRTNGCDEDWTPTSCWEVLRP